MLATLRNRRCAGSCTCRQPSSTSFVSASLSLCMHADAMCLQRLACARSLCCISAARCACPARAVLICCPGLLDDACIGDHLRCCAVAYLPEAILPCASLGGRCQRHPVSVLFLRGASLKRVLHSGLILAGLSTLLHDDDPSDEDDDSTCVKLAICL